MMKLISFLAFSMTLNAPVWAAACSQDEVDMGEELLTRTQKTVQHGFGNKVDVLLIKKALLDLKFCAAKLAQSEYCSQKEDILIELLHMAKLSRETSIDLGTDSLASTYRVSELMREIVELRMSCATPAAPTTAPST